ncbi:NfeD family protein [Algoriphagus litoralis]|uniref:NfeD family protein n=1 Tax=Algoriphagus litoralis TaxID=2202829 RepID=UPI000DBACAD8|nr:NfeD family protein [Algoriphagus litoralis]
MTILILSSLLILGVILILIEVFFVPGTTVVGFLGLMAGLGGVYFAFLSFDLITAQWIAGITALVNVGVIWYGFSSNIWQRFALKGKIEGGVFDSRTLGLAVGMAGKSISDIKPFGKVIFGDQVYEVKSESGFIEVGKSVSIIRIENNKILVK